MRSQGSRGLAGLATNRAEMADEGYRPALHAHSTTSEEAVGIHPPLQGLLSSLREEHAPECPCPMFSNFDLQE